MRLATATVLTLIAAAPNAFAGREIVSGGGPAKVSGRAIVYGAGAPAPVQKVLARVRGYAGQVKTVYRHELAQSAARGERLGKVGVGVTLLSASPSLYFAARDLTTPGRELGALSWGLFAAHVMRS